MSRKELIAIPKTIEGLRDALFDEINAIREGKSNPQKARSIALLANKVIDSLRVQIQYGRLVNETSKYDKKEHYLGSKT